MVMDAKVIKERVAGALDKQARIRKAAEAEKRIRADDPNTEPTVITRLAAFLSGRSGEG